eukprot:TRINITY_DN4230_c4_g1_i1.p1 TRINITY_DN4230_c4_g1~~TRINITY_DN4230_c4_g1_i1.p1  ORF type:complete len:221 (+),score=60.33 TRINITY_DN4230_c4_g1_i1:122-784(+)
MMAVRYHGCTCHQRFCAASAKSGGSSSSSSSPSGGSSLSTVSLSPGGEDGDEKLGEESKPQPWYFHVIASFILVIHGFTFLVPQDPLVENEDGSGNGAESLSRWIGYDPEWIRWISPYAQGLAAVFNIALGLVSWWTPKESERYNRLIQLRVFAFCLNILHAYVTGPIIYQQGDDVPLLAPGRIIGLFRLSYLTPGLMAAGVTEVIVEKEQEQTKKKDKK